MSLGPWNSLSSLCTHCHLADCGGKQSNLKVVCCCYFLSPTYLSEVQPKVIVWPMHIGLTLNLKTWSILVPSQPANEICVDHSLTESNSKNSSYCSQNDLIARDICNLNSNKMCLLKPLHSWENFLSKLPSKWISITKIFIGTSCGFLNRGFIFFLRFCLRLSSSLQATSLDTICLFCSSSFYSCSISIFLQTSRSMYSLSCRLSAIFESSLSSSQSSDYLTSPWNGFYSLSRLSMFWSSWLSLASWVLKTVVVSFCCAICCKLLILEVALMCILLLGVRLTDWILTGLEIEASSTGYEIYL